MGDELTLPLHQKFLYMPKYDSLISRGRSVYPNLRCSHRHEQLLYTRHNYQLTL
ncbi:hypothetical protein BDR06DRAFT_58985 [Suillus hirtellus]|nr:hypothetical protein BDR06DRAFT_58985 [Suillus hirtellus]